MSEGLDRRLLIAMEKVRRKRKLEGMLREAQSMLKHAAERKSRYLECLQEEQEDVETLEKMTLTSMFYWMIGRKEEKLDKERQELVAAKLKYDGARKAAAASERSRDQYLALIDELGAIESEYETLLEEKRRVVYGRGDEAAAALSKLELGLSMKDGVVRELKEAVMAGDAALGALEMVKSSLRSAGNWGTWDMMGGRGWVTYRKHSQLDDARRRAMIAQEKLRRFRTELADAGDRLEISLKIDEFTRFADIFFDNLITDWSVQNQIYRAMGACDQALDQVRDALRACRRKYEETTRETGRLLEKRKEMILKA